MTNSYVMRTLITAMIAFFVAINVSAQDYKHIYQEQKKLTKLTQNALKTKVSKLAAKEAKKMEKEGWQAMPGKLPIERQLDRLYNAQYELDEEGKLKYVVGTGIATASSFSAAQISSSSSAREQIASNMGASLTSLVDERIQSQQFTTVEAATIQEMSNRSKQIFSQNLSNTEVMMEVYRKLSNGNIEVQTSIMYNSKDIQKVVRESVKREFEQKGLETATLDEKLGW